MIKRTIQGDSESSGKMRGKFRLRVVFFVGACAWMVLLGRLIQLQALQHESYAHQAREQHDRWVDVAARRGQILDREGRVLSLDSPAISFYCHPNSLERPEEVAKHFASKVGRPVGPLLKALQSERPFVYLARQVHEERAFAYRFSDIQGVKEQKVTRRYYPFGVLAGQLLGFVDIDNKGREGVELSYDETLRETAGRMLTKVDSYGKHLPLHSREYRQAQHGSSVVLTIDAVYQGILEEELVSAVNFTGAEGAYGILSQPRTGDILAMASVPLFDPNDPGGYAPGVRRNRVVTDSFEPGSTFKAITAAAVIDEQLANLHTPFFCENGSFVLTNGDTIRDVSKHGWLDMQEVLAKSSNIGTMKLARLLSRPNYYEYLRNFGFGTRTGVDLPAESAGLLRHARDWSDRSLETIAIGQEVSVTALQLTQAFGAIANGGLLMSPRIVRDGEDVNASERLNNPKVIRRVISEETSATMRHMLANVVRNGTGKRAQITGVEVAGKTGTAQRAKLEGGGYEDDEFVVSFIGFLPAEEPEYLCLIVMLNPRTEKWGSRVAAPIFRRVMEKVYFQGGVSRLVATSDAPEDLANNTHNDPIRRLPDLRGLGRKIAAYHADLRGLRIRFVGSGTKVISQNPSPGGIRSGYIECVLGDPEDAESPDGRMPLRQSVLLGKLARKQLAYSN